MELKIDTSKIYAVALEGGGARGSYEVGVWKALEEAGVRYNAVSGTSVGALNGSLMAMRDLERAVQVWENISYSKVMEVDDEEMRRLFSLELSLQDVKLLGRRVVELIKGGGFDVTPLRRWIGEVVDEKRVRKSDVDFYLTTYSLTDRKGLELRAADIEEGQLCDMLLASAYFPAFRNEKLGEKRYTDGGVMDAVPIHALIANGYRDIIVIRLYGFGVERRFRMPRDARLITIAPNVPLGSLPNFDASQSRRDMELGYYDAKRTLYGLYGQKYYVDRTWDEDKAYDLLRAAIKAHASKVGTLRYVNEKLLPRLSRELGVKGSYYELLIACVERAAQRLHIPEFRVLTDEALFSELSEALNSENLTFAEAAGMV